MGERTDYLKSSVDKYVITEMKSLKELKDNLDLEITNITSNSDLMEKNLDDGTKWDDVELMDCKDIFIKMMDWIRNYDTSNEEYTRKIRFTCHDGVNDLARRILEIDHPDYQDQKAITDLSVSSDGRRRMLLRLLGGGLSGKTSTAGRPTRVGPTWEDMEGKMKRKKAAQDQADSDQDSCEEMKRKRATEEIPVIWTVKKL